MRFSYSIYFIVILTTLPACNSINTRSLESSEGINSLNGDDEQNDYYVIHNSTLMYAEGGTKDYMGFYSERRIDPLIELLEARFGKSENNSNDYIWTDIYVKEWSEDSLDIKISEFTVTQFDDPDFIKVDIIVDSNDPGIILLEKGSETRTLIQADFQKMVNEAFL